MLMSTQAERYAHQFLDARALGKTLAPISSASVLSIADAYDIANSLDTIRIAEGDTPIGRKLGLTNRALWAKASEDEVILAPTWTTLFASTVRYLSDTVTIQSLTGAMQPKIEPEVVFKFVRTPSLDATPDELADCLEWMAHGLEIVVNPYGDQKSTVADAIAAFGMHGTLLIGEPHILSSITRHHLGQVLANASVSLSCDGSLLGAGFGSNVMENPLSALWHLHQLLKTQEQFEPLHEGEIITTGTWAGAYPVRAGQTWSSAFSGISLAGLSVSFV